VFFSDSDSQIQLKNKFRFPDAFLRHEKFPTETFVCEFEYAEFTIEDFVRDLIRVGNIHPALKLWAISVIMEA